MRMPVADKVPTAGIQLSFEKIVLMPMQESDFFAFQFQCPEPAVQYVTGFRRDMPKLMPVAVGVAQDKMGFDTLKEPEDGLAADVAAVDDDGNALFPKYFDGPSRFRNPAMRVADDAKFHWNSKLKY